MQESTCHWNARACVLWTRAARSLREGKVASEPEALIAWFGSLGLGLERIGLEAGPLSQWLYAAMREAGLAVELLETRHVRDAFQGDAGEDGPQRRARDCAADAAGLVPAGALQVDGRAGDAGAADGAQAGAIEAARHRDEPARHSARLRAEGRARRRSQSFASAGQAAGRRPCESGRWSRRRCFRSTPLLLREFNSLEKQRALRWRAPTPSAGC